MTPALARAGGSLGKSMRLKQNGVMLLQDMEELYIARSCNERLHKHGGVHMLL